MFIVNRYKEDMAATGG